MLDMAEKKMWTYPELRFIAVNQLKMDPEELAAAVNRQFHQAEEVRSVMDVQRVAKGKNIFNKDKDRRKVI
jgi:hypothetical protein